MSRVDSLEQTVRGALTHLRYSNAQPSVGKAWDAKAARAALAELAALARERDGMYSQLQRVQVIANETFRERDEALAERDRLAAQAETLRTALETIGDLGTIRLTHEGAKKRARAALSGEPS